MIIYKRKHTDDEDEIVPDGGVVRVSILAMDSTQRQIAAVDERVRDNARANRAILDRMKRDADRAQAFADHFSSLTDEQADHSAYGRYCNDLQDAWRAV